MQGLPLTQNWIGESFVHAICGPYLQRCGNKLGVLVCIDIEHLAPTHANKRVRVGPRASDEMAQLGFQVLPKSVPHSNRDPRMVLQEALTPPPDSRPDR